MKSNETTADEKNTFLAIGLSRGSASSGLRVETNAPAKASFPLPLSLGPTLYLSYMRVVETKQHHSGNHSLDGS